jgi:hypothetical protein
MSITKDIISDQRREDMLIGAFEGGSYYWAHIRKKGFAIIDKYKTKERPCSSEAMWDAIKAGETIEVHDAEDPKEKLGEINYASILKGEELMLKNQPSHFADIIGENDDAITADIWFQYAVLGDIVYG